MPALDKTPRPIRFGARAESADGLAGMAEAARAVEAAGYATLCVADHFSVPIAPLLALQAAADATSTLRLATTVLDHDFRHPAVLAKELATLDVLSHGRVEIGLGAGWLQADYEQSGIGFDAASVRIARLDEYVTVLKGLFAEQPFSFSGDHFTIRDLAGSPRPVQRPHPPIMIGGGGRRILRLAARQADIVSLNVSHRDGGVSLDVGQLTAKAFDERVAFVRQAAGARFDDLELNIALLGVSIARDPRAGVRGLLQRWRHMAQAVDQDFGMTEDDALQSPVFATGTIDQISEKLLEIRSRFGISYFTVAGQETRAALAPLVERLRWA